MADSILRLKVESQEYDNKLKRAAEGLTRYADQCRKVGGTLEVVEKETLDYVRAIGQMDTTSRTATGKLAEMKKTFTELSAQYKQLTDAEKQSPFGKALAGSLDTLKGRVAESKSQIDDINKSINGSGGLSGALDAVAGKFGLNIEQLTKFGGIVGVATTALNVAKDAFFNNEEQLDEWGRVVESSHSLYTGFLNALNTGDISGYLSNISQIVQAARDAYDALDNLGTYNAFNQINVERTRTNMTESIADYRGGKGTKETVKAAGEAYKKELQERKRLENDAYLAAVKRVAAERGANAKDLMDALSGTYGHYQDLKNVQPSGTRTRYIPGLPGQSGRYEDFKVAQNDQERLGEALRHLNDTELQSLQALGAQAQRTGTEIAQVDKQLTRVLNAKQPGESGGGGKGGKAKKIKPEEILPSGSVAELNKQMQELRKEQSLVTNTAEWKKYEEQIKEVNNQVRELKGELGIESLRGLKGVSISDSIKPLTREDIIKKGQASIENFKLPEQPEKRDALEGGKDIASGLQSVSSGLQQMGIELPDGVQKVIGVVQGIISVIQGVQTILEVFGTSNMTANTTAEFANTVALDALTGAVVANTAAVTTNTVTPSFFAGGGIVHAAGGFRVPGHSFSGDRVPALLNSGELVLNTGQQEVVAQALLNNNGGGRTYSGSDYVRGQNVFIGTNNYLRGAGQGQLVTTRMLRQYGLIN